MNEVLWLLSRGAGLGAFVALTLNVALGVLARSGRDVGRLGRFGVQELHRTLALTALGLLVTHVASLLLDSSSGVGPLGALVPFTTVYAPIWVGLGVVATYLVALATLSGLLRNRLGPRAFKILHLTTYALWPVAALHFLGAGTDGHSLWAWILVGVTGVITAKAIWWRRSAGVVARGRSRRPRPVAAGARS